MLKVGDRPADFTLLGADAEPVHWASLRGRPVVIFAYPKASTPGCTKEACAFRDLRAEFEELGVAVYGLSADTPKRQQNFQQKYDLNLPLLSDPEHIILEPWGIWAEKRNYGRTYMGIVRSTFLFDEEGVVRQVWPKVKVAGHADEVLEAARELVRSDAAS